MSNTQNGSDEKASTARRDREDVAVYLDFENLYISLKTTVKMDPNFDLLMEKCREFGRVTVARAYADWSEFRGILTSQMFANGFEPVYVPTRKFYDAKTRAEARKNSVDIHITIDIIKSLFMHENVDVFILISGDRDYVPLINNIRQHGKSVYAIGVAGCTSGELSAAVDEMFFYHQLLDKNDDEGTEEIDVYNQLMRAIRIARRRGYPPTLGILKPIMKELVEGFNERNYKNSRGAFFQKFKDLILEAQHRRLVRLVTTGAVNEVFLFGEEPGKVEMPMRPEPSSSRGRGRDRDRDRDRGGRGDRGRRGEARPIEEQPAGSEVPGESVSMDVAAHELAPDVIDAVPVESADGEATSEAVTERKRPERERGGRFRERGRRAPRGEETPAVAVAPVEEVPVEAEAPASEEERLTGLVLEDKTWEVLRGAVESFGAKPPSPRKLVIALKQARDEGRFGDLSPTEADLQDLVRQAVDAGRLERLRKGFTTIYKLPEATA